MDLNLLHNFVVLLLLQHLVPKPLNCVFWGVGVVANFARHFVQNSSLKRFSALRPVIATGENEIERLENLEQNDLPTVINISELRLPPTRLQLKDKFSVSRLSLLQISNIDILALNAFPVSQSRVQLHQSHLRSYQVIGDLQLKVRLVQVFWVLIRIQHPFHLLVRNCAFPVLAVKLSVSYGAVLFDTIPQIQI